MSKETGWIPLGDFVAAEVTFSIGDVDRFTGVVDAVLTGHVQVLRHNIKDSPGAYSLQRDELDRYDDR
jgi:hypothetical protein